MYNHRFFTRADNGELLLRAATLGAQSWNSEARTLEVTFATSNPAERQDHRGAYLERLDMAQDWSGFIGAPVLDSHKRGALGDVLGSVIAAKTVAVRVAQRSKSASAGRLRQSSTISRPVTSAGFRWAIAWRSGRTAPKVKTAFALRRSGNPRNYQSSQSAPILARPSGVRTWIRKQRNRPIHRRSRIARQSTSRSGASHVSPACRSLGRTRRLIRPQPSTPPERPRSTAMQARSDATAGILTATAGISGHDATDSEWRTRTIGEAVFSRMSGVAPSEAARPSVNLTMIELAKDCLRSGGLSTTGSPATIMERALLTTSDLPAIMADSVNRTMRMAYEAAPSGLKRVAHQTTARDFRMKHRIQLSAAPILQPVSEDGEFRAGALADQEETYRLQPFGHLIGFSRQAFVNDDLGALNDVTRRMGVAAANFEAQFLCDLVTTNPLMAEGVAVFSTQHGNLAGTGAVISEASLTAARLAMRQQTEMSGMLIDITPKYLIVPSALETIAEKTVTSIQATQTSNVNPFAFLSVIVEPRFTSATAWFVAADPGSIDGLEYCYLEGEAGPQIFSEVGFEVDGIRFKLRLDFGGGWVEPRGFYKQPGA